jgi:hypothetical protein
MNKIIPFVLISALVVIATGFILRNSIQKTNHPEITKNVTTNSTTAKRPMVGQESFGLSVCEEVPKNIIESVIGKIVNETEDKSSSTGTGCSYYTNKAKLEHVLVQVSYLSVDNQKKGQEALGRTITTNNAIPMENFIALQENSQINAIYLIMTPGKYVRIDRTSNTADNEQLISLAKQIAIIINGK